MTECGLIVICSFILLITRNGTPCVISFLPANLLRSLSTRPLKSVSAAIPKGLAAKAQAGRIKNFTGVDAPYERPQSPDIRLATVSYEAKQLVEQLLRALADRSIISAFWR